MNPTLMRALLRQRATSPVRLVLLIVFFSFPLLFGAMSRSTDLSTFDSSYLFVLILGAGVIGQDLSSGVLQLTFARPITRPGYVLTRWGTVAAAAFTLAVVQLLAGIAVLAANGHAPDATAVAGALIGALLTALGAAGVIVFFSSLLPGFGDLGLLLLAAITGGTLGTIGRFAHVPVASRISEELLRFAAPHVELPPTLDPAAIAWAPFLALLSNLALCLLLAILTLNRRELSYATG